MSKRRKDPQQEIARRAKRYANANCKDCCGTGIMGRHRIPGGSTQLIICRCAYAGFPWLNKLIKVPDGKRNLSPR